MTDRAVHVALRRLLPLLVLMHVIAYVDRVNITFAESQLERDLALSASAFGLAAGIFFVGYVLFEVPSNLALWRVGARRWLARIMISWGLVAAATGLVWDTTSLLVARVLLGVAEAGFFPGVIFFLACWFPAERRGEAMSLFMLGVPIALVLGGPVSGALLELDGVLGIEGWRWLFLLEGLPAVAVGVHVWRALPDRPSQARWLGGEDAAALERAVAAGDGAPGTLGLRAALRDRRVHLLAATYFALNFAAYGTLFWLADIVERIGGLSSFEVGLLATIPFALGAIGLLAIGRYSDRSGDRRRVLAGGLALGGLGIAGTGLLPPVVALVPAALATFGILGAIPAFWTLPTALLRGRAAAGGIALINSIGVLGGLPGPVVIGAIKDATGTLDLALLAPAAACFVGATLALATARHEPAPSSERLAPAVGG